MRAGAGMLVGALLGGVALVGAAASPGATSSAAGSFTATAVSAGSFVATPSPADSSAGTASPRSPAAWSADSRMAGRDTFPHAAHEGLFPLCTGCHQGVDEGDEEAFYPDPGSCAGCHDGVEVEEVEWVPPGPGARPDNLDFSHERHLDEVSEAGDEALACQQCHASPGGGRMSVDPLEAGRCLSCHGEEPVDHYENTPCAACHVPLAATELSVERIAAMTVPEDHRASGFVLEMHGELSVDETSRCATCHTRDRCQSCHVDAAESSIEAMPPAPASLELPPAPAHYPVPESHQSPEFQREHGELAATAECATCHTREDCASCHLPPLPETADGLPARRSVLAPGVGLVHEAPGTHASPFFMDDHPALAAADPEECASCHTQPFCTDCHDGPRETSFHPPDFMMRHAADAWSQTAECANCHDVQAFCRSCHLGSGFGSVGRLGVGYHDAEPLWLLRHGQAARQSLEACASCHTQRECLQCHSQAGAFQIDPHGPSFDARRAWERNPGICLACHLESPFGGTSP